MTSTEQSKIWAASVVRGLEKAYQPVQYWEMVDEMVKPLNDFQVLVRYRCTKRMIRKTIQLELDKFLNEHIKECQAAGESPRSPDD